VVQALTLLVLLGTIALVAAQPGGLKPGVAAVGGTVLVLLLGTATLRDVGQAAMATAQVLLFLVAMMVVATIVEAAGCFEWAAERAVALSHGDGRRLFFNLYLLGAVVTLFLSLDVTAIMLAPVVMALVRRARLSPLPYIMAVAYVANTASLFLPVSNLTNMLVYGLLRVPFWDFVRLLALPNLAAIAVNLAIFWWLFRPELRVRFSLPVPADRSKVDPSGQRIVGGGLALVVLGLLVFGALGLPLDWPALAGAIGLGAVALARGEISGRRLLAGVAWTLPLFVIGMDVVVLAAYRAGVATIWRAVLAAGGSGPSFVGLLAVTAATALGSNLVNNLPMALVAIAGLSSGHQPVQPAIAFAALIGTNVGPNVTIFGSLATMLVLHAASRGGWRIGGGDYLRVGLLTTPPMLLAAVSILWILTRS
jgi:arsenical pump membrane protein